MSDKPAHIQLAHIAGPVPCCQRPNGIRCKAFQRQAAIRRAFQEMIDQRADILGTLAQRWQAQRHNIQPVKQVLAEQALLHQMLQVVVGSRDDAHIGSHRLACGS